MEVLSTSDDCAITCRKCKNKFLANILGKDVCLTHGGWVAKVDMDCPSCGEHIEWVLLPKDTKIKEN